MSQRIPETGLCAPSAISPTGKDVVKGDDSIKSTQIVSYPFWSDHIKVFYPAMAKLENKPPRDKTKCHDCQTPLSKGDVEAGAYRCNFCARKAAEAVEYSPNVKGQHHKSGGHHNGSYRGRKIITPKEKYGNRQ